MEYYNNINTILQEKNQDILNLAQDADNKINQLNLDKENILQQLNKSKEEINNLNIIINELQSQPTQPELTTIKVIDNTGNPNNLNLGFNIFENIEIGKTKTGGALTVTNTGQNPLVISKVEIDSQDFGYESTCILKEIQPNDSCEIKVYFTPSKSGDIKATLSIYANITETKVNVELFGSGKKSSDVIVVGPPENKDRPTPPSKSEAHVIKMDPGEQPLPDMPSSGLIWIEGKETVLRKVPTPKGRVIVTEVKGQMGTPWNGNTKGELWVIGGFADGHGNHQFGRGDIGTRMVCLGTTIKNYRRGYYGFRGDVPLAFEHYDGRMENIGEDCYQGGPCIVKNIVMKNVGQGIGHSDIFQAIRGQWIVDGITFEGPWGVSGVQLIASGNTRTKNSIWKNIDATEFAGDHGNGVFVKAENQYFENVHAPKMFWRPQGGNGKVVNCTFKGISGDWTY